jgi:hypothetical protein
VHRRRRDDLLHRAAHPTVAPAGEGLDVPRVEGAVAEGGPDLPDAEVQRLLEVDEGADGPDLRLDLLAGDDLRRVTGEKRQHLERLGLEANEAPAAA